MTKYTYGAPGQDEGNILGGRLATEVIAAIPTLTGYALSSQRYASLTEILATGVVLGTYTGNAATATALQTARTINGVSFDGTANITVTAAAGTLTGATLASNILASSLTSVGTLAALTVTATITGAVSGNAGTATALETARTINTVSFDGTANITVTAAAGTLTGTTLKSTVVSSSLTSLGTIASLVATTADINAGTVDAVIGGTTPAAATFTTLNATGGGALTGTWTDLGTVTTVDINGGTIDATVIGAASAAAATVTTLACGAITGTGVANTITATDAKFTVIGTEGREIGMQSDDTGNTARLGAFSNSVLSIVTNNVAAISIATDQAVSCLDTLAVTGAFGCNAAAVQTAFASGGALNAYVTGAFGLDSDANMNAMFDLVVAVRAALVANGIMS